MVGDIRTLSPLLLPTIPLELSSSLKFQIPSPWSVGSLKTKSEDMKKKIQEVKLCHSLTSGRTFDAWSEFGSFRHVEEVVSCGTGGNPVGQLGDPLGRIQAAGIYLKSCLGLYLA